MHFMTKIQAAALVTLRRRMDWKEEKLPLFPCSPLAPGGPGGPIIAFPGSPFTPGDPFIPGSPFSPNYYKCIM